MTDILDGGFKKKQIIVLISFVGRILVQQLIGKAHTIAEQGVLGGKAWQ
jgi:hypothetical protein